MINRDDMLELTRRMTPKRCCFTRVAGAYTNMDREVGDTFNIHFLKLSASDQTRNLNLAKTVPFARTNDQLKEYRFNNTGGGSMWQILESIRGCRLQNDALLDVFYEQILDNYDGGSPEGIYMYVFHGTYDVPSKGTDGAYIYDGDEIYDFIICTVGGLLAEYTPDKPDFGFLYPAFTDRCGDKERIDIFQADPRYPEEDMISMLLGKIG